MCWNVIGIVFLGKSSGNMKRILGFAIRTEYANESRSKSIPAPGHSSIRLSFSYLPRSMVRLGLLMLRPMLVRMGKSLCPAFRSSTPATLRSLFLPTLSLQFIEMLPVFEFRFGWIVMLDVVIAELSTLADVADSEPTGATCRLPLGETIRSPVFVSSILRKFCTPTFVPMTKRWGGVMSNDLPPISWTPG